MSKEGTRDAQAKRLDLWQRKLLPFMVIAITLMAGFFFVASLWQLQEFRADTRAQLVSIAPGSSAWKTSDERDYMQWRALVELETHVVTRRYEQVRTTMLLRAWTRYVGFLTGMILALVGAVFVLGKLGGGDDAPTEVATEAGGFVGKVTTPYPGVALALLGTTLMALAILVPFNFDTRDTPAYLRPLNAPAEPVPDPGDWPEPDATDPPEAAAAPPRTAPAPSASVALTEGNRDEN
jgi:hypothetical protein